MRRLNLHCIFVACLLGASCLGQRPRIERPEYATTATTLTLLSQFSIPALTRYPPIVGLPFGGISGLTASSGGREIYGISDASYGGRIYRFGVVDPGGTFSVPTLGVVAMTMAPEDTYPDFEGIALLPNGTFAVSSEGTDEPPRLPPSIDVYGRYGDYVSSLIVPQKFMPETTGAATRGARGNAGFESVTLTPDGSRLFTAAELPLIQDGDPPSADAGARTRILEYEVHGETFTPAREFAYDLEPSPKVSFPPGASINGVVELLALDRTTLLTLERGHVENKDDPAQSRTVIRLYKVVLAAATDVSGLESLRGRTDVSPAAKTLLLDLSTVPGLSPELAPRLDNFEGMTFGPRLADGRATLLLVSDDNFSAAQRTWFLLFAIE